MICLSYLRYFFFFSSRRRHTRYWHDWSSDVCSSDLEVGPGGVGLLDLERIDTSRLAPELRGVEVLALTDVDNPLVGPDGAAVVFGPQKGATPDDVALLDRALARFAAVVRRDTGVDVASMPGAGAAGGVGASLVAF